MRPKKKLGLDGGRATSRATSPTPGLSLRLSRSEASHVVSKRGSGWMRRKEVLMMDIPQVREKNVRASGDPARKEKKDARIQ